MSRPGHQNSVINFSDKHDDDDRKKNLARGDIEELGDLTARP
jgi:hypothetical protein